MVTASPSLKSALDAKLNSSVETGPQIGYVGLGDFLTVHFADCKYVGHRVDELLTVYRSVEDGALVGCKIKGVSLLAKNVSSMFTINDDNMSLQLLLLSAAGPKPSSEYYYELCNRAETLEMNVPKSLLIAA